MGTVNDEYAEIGSAAQIPRHDTLFHCTKGHPAVWRETAYTSTTVRSWSARLSGRGPLAVATTMSSMRAPYRPAR